mgnify:CR=1 FL=1
MMFGTTVVTTSTVKVVMRQTPSRNTSRMAFTRLGFLNLVKNRLTSADILPSKKSTNGLSRKATMPATANGNNTGDNRYSSHATPQNNSPSNARETASASTVRENHSTLACFSDGDGNAII